MVSSFAAGLAEGAVKGMDIRSHRLAEKAKLDAAKEESKTQREWQSAENVKTRQANVEAAEVRLRAQQRDAKIARGHQLAGIYHSRVSRTGRSIAASEIPADARLAMITAGYLLNIDGSYSPKSAELTFQHNTIGKMNDSILQGKASLAGMPHEVQLKHIKFHKETNNITMENARRQLESGSFTHYNAKKRDYMNNLHKARPNAHLVPLELKVGNSHKLIGDFAVRVDRLDPYRDIQLAGIVADKQQAEILAGDKEMINFALYRRLNDRIAKAKSQDNKEELKALEQYFNSSHRKGFKDFINLHSKETTRGKADKLIVQSRITAGLGMDFIVNLQPKTRGPHTLAELYRLSEMKQPSNEGQPTTTKDKADALGMSTQEYIERKAKGQIDDPVTSKSKDSVEVTKLDRNSPDVIKKDAEYPVAPQKPVPLKNDEIAVVSTNNGADVDTIPNSDYYDTAEEIQYAGMLDLKRKKDLVTYGNDRDNAIFNTVDRLGVYSGFNDAVKQSTQRGEVREDTYQGLFDSVKKLMGNSATDDEVFTAVNGIYMQRILYKYGTTGTGRATPGQILKFGKRAEHDFTETEALLYKEAVTLDVKLEDFTAQQKRFNVIRKQTGLVSTGLKNYEEKRRSGTYDDAALKQMRVQIARDVAAIYNDPNTDVIELIKKRGLKHSEKDLHALARQLKVAGTAKEDVFTNTIHKAFNVFQDLLNASDFLKETINWRTFGITLAGDPRTQERDLVSWARNFNSKDKRKLQGTRNRLQKFVGIAESAQREGLSRIKKAQDVVNELGGEKGSEQYVLAQANLMQAYLAARRDMLKVAMTYTFAGMLQGESGGRSISNEDFQIIYDSLWSSRGGIGAEGRVDEFNETVNMIRNRVKTNLKYIGYGPKHRPMTQLPKSMLGLSRAKQRFTLKRKYPTGIYSSLSQAPAETPVSGWASLPLQTNGITSFVDIQKGKTPQTFSRQTNSAAFLQIASRLQNRIFSGIFTAVHRNLTDETRKPFGQLNNSQQGRVAGTIRVAAEKLLEEASQSKNLARQLGAIRFNNSRKSLGEMLKSWVDVQKMDRYKQQDWYKDPENVNFMTEFLRQMHDSVVNHNDPGAAR